MRVRENAESIAFYGGEDNEKRLLTRRLRAVVDNFMGGWVGGRGGWVGGWHLPVACLPPSRAALTQASCQRRRLQEPNRPLPPTRPPACLPARPPSPHTKCCRAAEGLPQPQLLHLLLSLPHPDPARRRGGAPLLPRGHRVWGDQPELIRCAPLRTLCLRCEFACSAASLG